MIKKPCPFCGCKKIILEETTKGIYVLECTKCGAAMYSIKSIQQQLKMTGIMREQEIVHAWNKRVGA